MSTLNQLDELVISEMTAQEAHQLIDTIIQRKINNCNIKYMSIWEGNHNVKNSEVEQEIEALRQQQQALKKKIAETCADGRTICFKNSFEVQASA